MNPTDSAQVDHQLATWISGVLENFLKRGFTAKDVTLALALAHERFIVQHLYDGEAPPITKSPTVPKVMPDDAPTPKKRGRPKGSKNNEGEPDSVFVSQALGPDDGICSRCFKKMKVENTSNARYTIFVLWKCKCGFSHLQKKHVEPQFEEPEFENPHCRSCGSILQTSTGDLCSFCDHD